MNLFCTQVHFLNLVSKSFTSFSISIIIAVKLCQALFGLTQCRRLAGSHWPAQDGLSVGYERARLFVCVYIFFGESALSLSLFCPLSPINRPADKIIMLQFSNLFSAFNFSLVSASSIKRAHYQKLSAKSSQELHHPFGLWEKRCVWPQDIAAATAETSSTTWSQLIICSLKLSELDSICQMFYI